jgi:hypothetical protein
MLIRKIQKNKKNQIYKKKRVEGPSWKPSSIFTYKYWSPQHTLGGAILHFWKETQENPKPKIFSRNQDKPRPPPLAFDFFSPHRPPPFFTKENPKHT